MYLNYKFSFSACSFMNYLIWGFVKNMSTYIAIITLEFVHTHLIANNS